LHGDCNIFTKQFVEKPKHRTMHHTFLSLILCLIVCANPSSAQTNDLPLNAQPGKCYAQCIIPDQYETIVEEVLLKEASTRIEITPAVYEKVEEQVLEKEGYKILNIVPATFGTVKEEILVKEASKTLQYVPPIFETITEQILVQPAATKWVKGKADKNCLNENDPEACKVWCLEEIPAKYKTITRQVLKSPASTTETPISAEYKTITKAILQSPAQIAESEIPAEYRTLVKKVLVQPATSKEMEILAEYSTVTRRKLIAKEKFSRWVEVLCETNCFPSHILALQQALKHRGYYKGVLDNVLGPETKKALIQYQKDKGFPTGNVNMETMRSLGLK